MTRKSQNIIKTKEENKTVQLLAPWVTILFLMTLWQVLYMRGIVPSYMLPSPVGVVKAFTADFPLLMEHAGATLAEAFLGLAIGVVLGFAVAALMERYELMHEALYPVLVVTQTIPTVAIAPLLVLWMGYGIAPKVTLVVLITFFPIAVGLLDGFTVADVDAIQLLRAMGATRFQIFRHIKLPSALNHFYAGLRISVSYAIVGAVIAEWLGGFHGLGVYMTRVKKSYSYDKMFAVIFLISAISLVLMYGVNVLQRWTMPWQREETDKR